MIYAIGDIHGQLTMLRTLLTKLTEIPLKRDDTVVFLGDYVDRGENCRGVIETLLQWQQRHTTTVFLRGNHEQLMLDAYGDGSTPIEASDQSLRAQLTLDWLQNGGVETLLCHPASMTHASVPPERRAAIGLTDSLLRISAGIEDPDDLIDDLKQALA